MIKTLIALVLAAALVDGAGYETVLASGLWGGDHLILTVTGHGTRVESDRGEGTIEGAITLHAGRNFTARGRFHDDVAGSQSGDATATGDITTYAGSVDGDVMTLTVSAPGHDPRRYTLKRGHAVKLLRRL